MAAPFPEQRVLGIKIPYICIGGQAAKWSYEDRAAVQQFMTEDEDFFIWKRRMNYRVTITTLRDFPVVRIRPLIGAGGLEGVINVEGEAVLPILDGKIRHKMAVLWRDLPKEDQLSGVLPWPTRPQTGVQHHLSPSHLSLAPAYNHEEVRARRRLAEIDEQMARSAYRLQALSRQRDHRRGQAAWNTIGYDESSASDDVSSSDESEGVTSDFEERAARVISREAESRRRLQSIARAIQAKTQQ
ncbi:hypothetical protein IFR04_012335 [Cadophora malorum]|uniref:Uncharacterized protein n=1 Tax=Cadophora malorum TaxID=108018 RepID=A0A8H7T6W4_9HELO|nr:hypothetical protein IFR04_012335 [Cadophora malorum]